MAITQKTINYETTDFENSFQLVHKITTKRFQYGTHIHTRFYEIHFLIRGEVEFAIEEMRKKFEHGDVTVIAPGEIHRPYINDNKEYERIVFHISDNLLTELSTPRTNLQSMFRRVKTHFIHFTDEELEEFFIRSKEINKYVSNPEQPGADILMQSYLNIILMQILNKLQISDENTGENYVELSPLIGEAVEYIKGHLTEDISVQSVADQLNISRSYLSRIFKERTGYSLWNYVLSKRLILSQKLIMEGRSVTEACFDSGFRDYAHFIKSFSRTFGIPPKKYREQTINQITINIIV